MRRRRLHSANNAMYYSSGEEAERGQASRVVVDSEASAYAGLIVFISYAYAVLCDKRQCAQSIIFTFTTGHSQSNQSLRRAKNPGSSHCHRNDVRCRAVPLSR